MSNELKQKADLRKLILKYLRSYRGSGFTFKYLYNKLILEQEDHEISENDFKVLLNEMENAEKIYLHKILYKRCNLQYYSSNPLSFHIHNLNSLPKEQILVSKWEILKARHQGSDLRSQKTNASTIGHRAGKACLGFFLGLIGGFLFAGFLLITGGQSLIEFTEVVFGASEHGEVLILLGLILVVSPIVGTIIGMISK